MNISNICAIADTYYMAENKGELDQKYIASSDIIISDGTNSHHINKDGYIDIEDVKNANYIIFADQNGNIFLGIYKYMLEPKYKEVIDGLNSIRSQLGMHRHSTRPTRDNIDEYHGSSNPKKSKPVVEEAKREDDNILKRATADLVNVNSMTCSVCGSNEFNEPFHYDNQWNITCQCKKCGSVYELVPSKYYIIKSITKYTDTTNNGINKTIIKNLETKENSDE